MSDIETFDLGNVDQTKSQAFWVKLKNHSRNSKMGYSHSGYSVIHAISQIIDWRGKPTAIRCDNGPEFLSHVVADFCNNNGIELKYIQPGKPTQNAYIERFNRTYREDILDAYYFNSLQELEELSMEWMKDYNELHPHQSLKNMSPIKYLETIQQR